MDDPRPPRLRDLTGPGPTAPSSPVPGAHGPGLPEVPGVRLQRRLFDGEVELWSGLSDGRAVHVVLGAVPSPGDPVREAAALRAARRLDLPDVARVLAVRDLRDGTRAVVCETRGEPLCAVIADPARWTPALAVTVARDLLRLTGALLRAGAPAPVLDEYTVHLAPGPAVQVLSPWCRVLLGLDPTHLVPEPRALVHPGADGPATSRPGPGADTGTAGAEEDVLSLARLGVWLTAALPDLHDEVPMTDELVALAAQVQTALDTGAGLREVALSTTVPVARPTCDTDLVADLRRAAGGSDPHGRPAHDVDRGRRTGARATRAAACLRDRLDLLSRTARAVVLRRAGAPTGAPRPGGVLVWPAVALVGGALGVAVGVLGPARSDAGERRTAPTTAPAGGGGTTALRSVPTTGRTAPRAASTASAVPSTTVPAAGPSPVTTTPPDGGTGATRATRAAVAALPALATARAEALERRDPSALTDVDLEHSAAWQEDTALLLDLERQGLRWRGLDVDVTVTAPARAERGPRGRWTVTVPVRTSTAPYTTLDVSGAEVARTRASTSEAVVVLRQDDRGRWRVADVRPAG